MADSHAPFTTMDHYDRQEALSFDSRSLGVYDQTDEPLIVFIRRMLRYRFAGKLYLAIVAMREHRRGKWFHTRAFVGAKRKTTLVGVAPVIGSALQLAAAGRGRARIELLVEEDGPRISVRDRKGSVHVER